MQHHGIGHEIRRFIGVIALSALIGFLLNQHILFALVLGLGLYCLYHIRNLQQLLTWLKHRKLDAIEDRTGAWGQAFDMLGRHQRREVKERNRLKSVIKRVETTTSALNDAVILVNNTNALDWWNKATERLLGLKQSDRGNSIINYIRHPKFVSYLEAGDYTIPLTLPSPRHIDIKLEFQITRFGIGEGLIVVRDITRIYKLEKMRKDFVGNVGHELRTPLTVIRGYLETLEDSKDPGLKDNTHLQKALEQMQQQAARMTTMINDLTMLSKLETDRTDMPQQSVALRPLLEMICNEARAISGDNQHTIHLSCDSKISLWGNDRELHSAFSNLLTNAVKYSPAGKSITVTATIDPQGNLVVSVMDEGVGIEPQHISRLTERFYRVDASRSIQTGGTGLGLAIVKHILLRHDSRLKIESTYGEGSTFSCVFPEERISVDNQAVS